jgi:hypothetical protein
MEFIFTSGEQTFFADRGFRQPTRCKVCRQAKKARQQETVDIGPGMGGYSTPPEHRPRRSDRGSRRNSYED